MRPKRSFGQNFLQDRGAARKIAAALDPHPGETIIEIGPGHGELTEELRIENRELRILAIEKDERLVGLLRERFRNDRNIEILTGDALKLLPSIVSDAKYQTQNTKYSVAGNIPYYITGHLLHELSELEPKPKTIVLTVQKEVAERICATAPKMNLLSASVQFWARPEIIARIGRQNFRPVPEVDSAVVRIVPKRRVPMKPVPFFDLLRTLFKQPRKTILNNLASGGVFGSDKTGLAEHLRRLGIDPEDRPQNLDLLEIVRLAQDIETAKNH